ncbi:MAG: hypothetical protein HYW49_06310 [Deltaproteobacteria bacterium]|nr:hypothetical protein [Deltaproteobacteria bacterium]
MRQAPKFLIAAALFILVTTVIRCGSYGVSTGGYDSSSGGSGSGTGGTTSKGTTNLFPNIKF